MFDGKAHNLHLLSLKLGVLCAACLIALCFTHAALAAGSSNQGIDMHIPPVFWLGWDGHECDDEGDDVIYNLNESQIMAGEQNPNYYIARMDTDQLSARSNYRHTSLQVTGGDEWAGALGGDGDFDLRIDWGSGWRWLDGDTEYIFSNRNGIDSHWHISYRLYHMGLEDDPDAYTTTVVFTLSHT